MQRAAGRSSFKTFIVLYPTGFLFPVVFNEEGYLSYHSEPIQLNIPKDLLGHLTSQSVGGNVFGLAGKSVVDLYTGVVGYHHVITK